LDCRVEVPFSRVVEREIPTSRKSGETWGTLFLFIRICGVMEPA
jgi:hypothetical protein